MSKLAETAAQSLDMMYAKGVTDFMEAAVFSESDFSIAGDTWTSVMPRARPRTYAPRPM